MVWGVCRRVLRSHEDAEDTFQATFLVLVRKAGSIVPREMVANWLYGVAHQTALNARATAAKRKGRERQVTEMPEPAVAEQDLWRDLQPVLDEELSRLPDKYRAVIVLCDLEGKTRKEAARRMGVPEGTVAGRLARARTMLAKRLTQRGVTLSGGVLAAVLSENMAAAAMPSSVVSSTIKAASLLGAGRAAGVVSARVAALAEGVVKAMFVTKLKSVLAVVLVLGFVATGATLLPHRTAAAGPDVAERAVVVPAELPAKRREQVPDHAKKMRMIIASKGRRSQVRVTFGDTKYSVEADEIEYDEERGSLFVKGNGILYTRKEKEPVTTLKGEAILVYPNPEKPMSKDPTIGRP
jgi:RNA polymerase sigma factor (sigma-70 family)